MTTVDLIASGVVGFLAGVGLGAIWDDMRWHR